MQAWGHTNTDWKHCLNCNNKDTKERKRHIMACWLKQEGAEQDDSVRNWNLNTVTKSALFSCSLLQSASSASRSSSLTRWLTSLFTPGENRQEMKCQQGQDDTKASWGQTAEHGLTQTSQSETQLSCSYTLEKICSGRAHFYCGRQLCAGNTRQTKQSLLLNCRLNHFTLRLTEKLIWEAVQGTFLHIST